CCGAWLPPCSARIPARAVSVASCSAPPGTMSSASIFLISYPVNLRRPCPKPPPRPQPCHKRVWAGLSQGDEDDVVQSGLDLVYDWLPNEVAERNPGLTKEMVHLGDGQESLWQARQEHLRRGDLTEVLDSPHVTHQLE